MAIQEKFIDAIIESLSPYQRHGFRDGDGYKVLVLSAGTHKRMTQREGRREVCFHLPSGGFFLLFLLL